MGSPGLRRNGNPLWAIHPTKASPVSRTTLSDPSVCPGVCIMLPLIPYSSRGYDSDVINMSGVNLGKFTLLKIPNKGAFVILHQVFTHLRIIIPPASTKVLSDS